MTLVYKAQFNPCVLYGNHIPKRITRQTPEVTIVVLCCGHEFCEYCISRVLAVRDRKCPLCRQRMNPTQLKNIIKKFHED
jgi:hypothetical protein